MTFPWMEIGYSISVTILTPSSYVRDEEGGKESGGRDRERRRRSERVKGVERGSRKRKEESEKEAASVHVAPCASVWACARVYSGEKGRGWSRRRRVAWS